MKALDPLIAHTGDVPCVLGEGPTQIPVCIDESNPYNVLNEIRLKCKYQLIFAQINVNSIRNKFHALADIISGKIDLLQISETKIGQTHPKLSVIILIKNINKTTLLAIILSFAFNPTITFYEIIC